MKFLLVLISCFIISVSAQGNQMTTIDKIAEDYVKLVLAVGLYDSTYIDAYFGPESWQPNESEFNSSDNFPYELLHRQAEQLISQLNGIGEGNLQGMNRARFRNLKRLLNSVKSRIELLNGKEMTFDEECRALFGFVEPALGDAYSLNILKELDSLIPGKGNIGDRFRNYQTEFLVPVEKVDTAFSLALQTARQKTKLHVMLPENEDFMVEYVTNKSWGGYCRFLGDNKSSIQINPNKYYIDWSIDLACHEGYPGHHVRGILMSNFLQKENGWIELLVFPLYNPLSIIDEGCADYAIDLVFPSEERVMYEKNVIFPLLGFDTSKADKYYKIKEKIQLLGRAFNETARLYLDGVITRDSARIRLEQLSLSPRAEDNLRFIEQFRSYCITYTIGKQIVEDFVGADSLDEKTRWEKFIQLQSNPTIVLDKYGE